MKPFATVRRFGAALRGLVAAWLMLNMAIPAPALADATPQSLPLSQNWTNPALITVDDNWSGVPGIVGYRGDDAGTTGTGTDPRTITVADDPGVVDVTANQVNPNTFATGGVAEFDVLPNPVVALQGSGTADVPYLRLHLNTTGLSSILLSYNVRDIDGSTDNAIQQVNAQYRVGGTGAWTNITGTYIADATTGPSLATLVTPISVTLPAAVDNQAQVQVRIMTTNAVGNDEWVGIDDISVTGTAPPPVHDINSGMNFLTIQAAINDGTTLNGHTIVVDPGTYNENVVLNKSLIFKGAKVGVGACGRVVGAPNPATESIVTAAGRIWELVTGSAGSTIDGFSFIGGSRSIESTSGPLNNLTIQNDHFAGFTGNAIFLNDPGIDVTVNANNVDGAARTGGDGSIHLDTDSFTGFWLTNNCIGGTPSAPVGSGFFVDGNHNVVPSAGRAPKIDGNILEKHTTNVGANLGSRAFNRGTISNNTIRDNAFDGIQGGIQDSRITGNKFLGNGRWGLALTSFASLVVDRGGQRDTVTGNTFTDNDSAGYFISATQAAGNAASCHANFNDIAGNGVGGTRYGAIYRGAETIDVGCNWWGDIGGPNYPPANPNPLGDKLFASSALFSPWLDSSISSANPQCNQTVKHTITASAGPGGSISPSGAIVVPDGGSQTFTITAGDKCHVIADVLVDGVSVGPVSTYTFSNVTADHTIAASFSVLGPFTITATAGPGGSISPSGAVSVACGAGQSFMITPASGYHTVDVVVDGSSVGPVAGYTFSDVQANHTISASFAANPAVIGAQSTATYICPTNPCVTLPVTIVRGASDPVLGFSVTIQLSANLSLCNVTGSITEGTFLSSQGPTTFQIIDNGGGSYTVDGALLANCGQTAASGTLFNVGVTSSDPGGVGSITTTTTLLRDCNNVPIPASPGAPGTVPIDNQAPVVTVISPNGGESWLIGSSQKISWSATDNTGVATIDLAYSTDGGATYPNVIATGVANSGTFVWTVPNTPTTQARVRVTAHDVVCSSGDDASDANFTIRDPIIVATAGSGGTISPSGSVSVPYGTNQTFTITPSDKCHVIADVKVDGVSVGPVASYTFTNVTVDHTIDATFAPVGTFTIVATAGTGGTISPSGSMIVGCGESQTFTIASDKCHVIADVKVDGVSVGPVATYTFTDVQINHTIAASFTEIGPFTITATAGTGGSIAPSGAVIVSCGASQLFNITPNAGYAIADVKVDNVSVGPVASYTFTDVQANHTIAASFVDIQCPSVTVIGPNGGEILIVGSLAKLSWTATDNSGTVTSIDLYISRDNGATYLKIASGIANTGTYTWLVDAPGTNTGPSPVYSALFRVDAHDAAGNVCSDASDTPFALYDLATAVTLSMFQAAPVGDAIELRWQLGDPGAFTSLVIERSEAEAGPWSEVALDRREESGVMVALDRAVQPEKPYYYRLVGLTATAQRVVLGRISGSARMRINELSLAKVSPNPSRDLMRIEYALPRETNLRLSVLDVAGREIAVLASGVFHAGRYQATWTGQTDRGVAAPAGIYFVRVSALGKNLTQRVVRTH